MSRSVDSWPASAHLLGLLAMKGAGNRTYYVAKSKQERRATGGEVHQVRAEVHQSPADLRQFPPEVHQLPEAMKAELEAAGPRPRRETLRSLILALCAWKPLSAKELAQMLGNRASKNLVRLHLGPMVEARELAYTVPEMVNHPDQKYTTPVGGAK